MTTNEISDTKRVGKVLFAPYEMGSGIKKAIELGRPEILFEVRESKLKGRGGAGFPTGTKWMLTAAANGDEKYVICNADEGEPGTFKDRVLLTDYADKVFDGMVIAGLAIGAKLGIVYLRGEYIYLLETLENFLTKMRDANLLGKNILGHAGFDFDIIIRLGSGAYVCGEETALIESLEGHRGEPRNRPPFPVNTGYLGCPTTVNNVETFATVPMILLNGSSWYSKIGTGLSTGSKLVSISGDCSQPGVYELDWGTTIHEMLEMVGAKNTKAVQIGGASGHCYNKHQFNHKISYEDAATGGSIMVFNESRDMLKVLKNFMEFFVEESCGQCTPCRIGNTKLLAGVEKIEAGTFTFAEIRTLKDLGNTMKLSSKCGLGQSSPNPFVSILDNFKDEIFNSKRNGVNHGN